MMGKLEVLVALGLASMLLISSKAEQCGSQAGGALCPGGLCCSRFGWCGNTGEYCDPAQGCQSQCWGTPTPTPSPPSSSGVASIVSRSLFDDMLKHRNDAACPARNFYTYDAFISAANAFGGFGTTGDLDTRKREIAAFLGQTSHETTGNKTRTSTSANQWVGKRTGWSLLMGILFQARARQPGVLLPAERAVAMRARQTVLRARTHANLIQLQLRPGRASHRGGPPQQPRPGGHRPGHLLQDGRLVLDDPAVAEAVVPRRHHGQMDAVGCRPGRWTGARLRSDHQHHQRGVGVRPRDRRQGGGPHRVLPEVLQHPRGEPRGQHRLLRPEALHWLRVSSSVAVSGMS